MDLLKMLAAMQVSAGGKAEDAFAEKPEPEPEPIAETCQKCGGKGYIGTGNNDIPCSCAPAGMVAFRMAGVPAWVIRDCATTPVGSYFEFVNNFSTAECSVVIDGKVVWSASDEQNARWLETERGS